MPLSVNAATPTLLAPYFLCRTFQQKREFKVDMNRYPDGATQAMAIGAPVAGLSPKRWGMTARLKPTDLQTLRNFYYQQGGGWREFWFYDLIETLGTYDPTASLTLGLYVVVFDGPFQQSLDMGRSGAQLSLVEVS